MEKAREALSVGAGESERVASLDVRPHRAGDAASFYEGFALRGIRVDLIQRGSLSCTFKVPPRLTDVNGNLSAGAIANLVDEVGGAVMHADGHRMKVSVDMSISYMSTAKVDNLIGEQDELEITSSVLGHKGAYTGTYVLLRNKTTGEIVAEGRHSLFGNLKSKI
ncbi:acyl-coenzyme A thioesterase 13-like isoform X1 [Phoenix dactylifera]|uniref:Acyl-coenzyme A thioesterase 13 n=1 Tax=Phoenix dactylifera TaxID=42345 RepID=A0A8B8ZW42_PHODC|nr:acyl-coenzyme A thioesterase 13 isoform X1 [Phoenix dactylifera]XP_038978510.1 acyl-coenzyme A thioesterase 13-like isoform X1 [Phoenix dactylifera]